MKLKKPQIEELNYLFCKLEMSCDNLVARSQRSNNKCTCKEKWLPLEEKTLYNLEVGDEVVSGTQSRWVLSVLPSNSENPVYVMSSLSGGKEMADCCFTAKDLSERGYLIAKPLPPTPPSLKLTKSEAEQKLSELEGKRVEIE